MTETTPRQVLYGLVAVGLHLVVAVLIMAAAALVPGWWTAMTALVWLVTLLVGIVRWRATRLVVTLGVGVFVVWTVGTLLVRDRM